MLNLKKIVAQPGKMFYSSSVDSRLIQSNSKIDVSINSLRDNAGAKKQPIRVGRGQGSRRPCTAGRGLKGIILLQQINFDSNFIETINAVFPFLFFSLL